ncbi:transcriptional regulator [Amycolatopsis thermophila]|uniref:Uncharacterized protein n=1 Tax=Amycolatopsis thermophila TaxID=206084 RepID=A0ABU0F2L2_9PSEU|nr:transcriptional regulator [Amycolatopsis thermophila]MDQ0381812.1 hypothetical protein [Amycolatopsis thermophila]
MTALPETSVPPATRAAPDDLVEELRGRLPALVDQALAAPEIAESERGVAEADRERVRAEVRARALRDGEDILRVTNPQISALRLARRVLADHERAGTARASRPPSPRDRTGHALVGFAAWLGLIFPLAFWQLGQTPLAGPAVFWVYAAVVVVAGVALRWAYLAVARAGQRFTGQRALAGAGWPVMIAVAVTLLLLIWRLGGSSQLAMGKIWSAVVWCVAVLAAAFVFLTVWLMTLDAGKDEEPGRRIPRAVARRTLLAVVVAGAAAYVLLSRLVPLPWADWQVWLLADAVTLLVMLGAAPLVLSPGLVPARWSPDPDRRGSPKWTANRRALRSGVEAAEARWRDAAMAAVRPVVTRHLNEAVHPAFTTTLPERLNRGGLGLMRAGDRMVDTAAFARLRALTGGITGGAIGIAGPRGAGKTTLLEAYQAGRFLGPGRQHIALLESVPVRYDARDFVLHLFGRTCAAVIEFCDDRVGDPPPRWTARLARLRPFVPLMVIVVVWVVVGFAGAAAAGQRRDFGDWMSAMWWPIVIVLAAGSVLYLSRRWRFAPAPAPAAARAPEDLAQLRDLARETLAGIEFQQKHTSGWSGKVGLLFGAEAGLTGSRELTRQPRSYPQIVHDFGEFLRATIGCAERVPGIAVPSLVIILDELDKILSPEEAQDFVNEVKALFTLDVPGFLFLVSVSEDALAAFERRGLPVRDAFDSAFDMIFRLEYLSLPDAQAVLGARVLGLPEPFVCLCHCLSGGLPRELVRVARLVTAARGTLGEVTRELVAGDLAGKVAGLRTVVAREAYDHVQASELVRHVEAHAVADAQVLLRAAGNPPIGDAGGPLWRIQLETLGYLYYLGTIREVFGDGFTRRDLDRGRDEAGDASFDTLTSVRRLFAVNARLAWLTISAFREAWGLPAVPPPEAG